MRIEQVALQLYTVRDKLSSPAEVAATLKRISEIGYGAVQLGGGAPMRDEELARILSDNGLICCSSHDGGADILDHPQTVIESLGKLDCTSTAYPYPGGMEFEELADVLALAKRLNNAGRVYREAGTSLAYHNHAIEFRRFGERLMLDVIYEETDPECLQGEPDTYWIQYGGGDPVGWCHKLKGRMPLLHMKDYKVTAEQSPTFAEIGQGNLDWPSIVAAAEEAGCEWYIVEQDRCDGDSLEAARASFDYIAENLCS
jgi:sugar phosphate isomerase/epimerase